MVGNETTVNIFEKNAEYHHDLYHPHRMGLMNFFQIVRALFSTILHFHSSFWLIDHRLVILHFSGFGEVSARSRKNG